MRCVFCLSVATQLETHPKPHHTGLNIPHTLKLLLEVFLLTQIVTLLQHSLLSYIIYILKSFLDKLKMQCSFLGKP